MSQTVMRSGTDPFRYLLKPWRVDRRRAEIIALQTVDPDAFQIGGIARLFHAFGNCDHVELFADGNQRVRQNLIVGVITDPADELTVDLENVEIEIPQIPE